MHRLDRHLVPLRRWAARAAVGVLACVVSVLTATGALEAWYRGGEGTRWVYVPGLLFARPPSWVGAGWVDGRPPPASAPGAARVVCVGDSLTEGQGVGAESAWPSHLRTLLGLRREEVHNLGVSGWDAAQVAHLVESRLEAWQPDVVVWGTYANDLLPTRVVYDAADGAPRWVASDPPPGVEPLPPPASRWLIPQSALYRVYLAHRYARSEVAHHHEPGGRDWYRAQVARLASWSRRKGTPVVVLAIPPHVLSGPCDRSLPCATLAGWYDTVRGVLAEQALPWVDGLAALEGGGPYYRAGSLDVDHPDVNAHRRLAVAVRGAVETALEDSALRRPAVLVDVAEDAPELHPPP